MSDYERFASLRRSLPDWWLSAFEEEQLWGNEGACFVVTRGQSRWPCVVPYVVLNRLAGHRLKHGALAGVWREHSDRFKSAGIRVVRERRPAAGTTIRLAMVDLVARGD